MLKNIVIQEETRFYCDLVGLIAKGSKALVSGVTKCRYPVSPNSIFKPVKKSQTAQRLCFYKELG